VTTTGDLGSRGSVNVRVGRLRGSALSVDTQPFTSISPATQRRSHNIPHKLSSRFEHVADVTFGVNKSPYFWLLAVRSFLCPLRPGPALPASARWEEIDAVLAAPDQSTWIGRRDYALLLTMYNSGARLSEMTCMRRGQVKFDSTTYLQLHGKGRKERVIPLWTKTGRVLRNWFRELELKATEVAFPSVRGTSLSSDGLDYILQQAVKRAAEACPSLFTKRVTPISFDTPALCICCKPESTWP
jgi:integrase